MILSYILLTVMILIWSFSFVLVDIAVDFIPPLSIALHRFIFASVTFLVLDLVSLIKKRKASTVESTNEINEKYSRNDWILIIISSFCGISLLLYSQYNAINLIGPSLPALFVCLISPVIISILALIFFDEKLRFSKIIGFIIATIGGFLLVTGGDMSNLSPSSPNFLGYFLALLAPILWAIYSTLTKRINKKSNFEMLKYICYFGTLELLILVIITGEFLIFVSNLFNLILILCSIYLGIGCYIIGYLIWQTSQKKMDSSKAASFLYIEPFITLLFSFLLQRDENIVIWNIIGGIIVLFAVLMINFDKSNKNNQVSEQ